MLATPLIATSKFAILASDAQIERTRIALEANNIHVIVTENGADAEREFMRGRTTMILVEENLGF